MISSIPNQFVITGTGFETCLPDERAFRFEDSESNTHLVLRCDPNGFEWELRDGSTDEQKTLWSGRLHRAHEIVSLLIRFGNNCLRSAVPLKRIITREIHGEFHHIELPYGWEIIRIGPVLKGDQVYNIAKRDFETVIMDGNIHAEQCHLVLRETSEDEV